MKKKLIAMLLVIIAPIAQSACSVRNEEKVVKTYMMELQSQSEKEIFSSKTFPYEVEWTDDGKHFALVEWVTNRIGNDDFFVRVFQTDSFTEIEIPKEINERKHCGRTVNWIDNKNLIVILLDSKMQQYFILNLEDNTVKEFTEEEMSSHLMAISSINEKLINRIDIPNKDDVRRELRKKIGTDYNEGILSLDSSKFLYSTEDNNVSLYDIKTDKNEELFKGFDLRWSLGENMISYTVPKGINVSEFPSRSNSMSSEMETYVYDLKKRQSIKVADFYAKVFFSPDDRYIIFYPDNYIGQPNV